MKQEIKCKACIFIRDNPCAIGGRPRHTCGVNDNQTNNSLTRLEEKIDWKERWNNKFFAYQEMGCIQDSDDMIPFIENLLKEQRQEVIKEIRESLPEEKHNGINQEYERDIGYNKCREQFISNIKELK